MDDKRILVVEDEAPIRQMMRFGLARAGFGVDEAGDAPAARRAVAERRPDLILLDWMLPGVSGLAYARELKSEAETRDLPIIMVTARVEEDDRVRGLDLGCDDYVTKPFSPSELAARVRAVLRRASPGGDDESLTVDDLVIDRAAQRVYAGDQLIDLGPTDYQLLAFFAAHPERVYSREQLLNRVWGRNVYVDERTVDVHIRRLRKALARSGHDRLIQTVRGSGYRFSARHE